MQNKYISVCSSYCRRLMQFSLIASIVGNIAETSYAGTGDDAVVVTVDGQGYLSKDMISDVRIMLENQMNYVVEHPELASTSDYYLKGIIKEKSIESVEYCEIFLIFAHTIFKIWYHDNDTGQSPVERQGHQ